MYVTYKANLLCVNGKKILNKHKCYSLLIEVYILHMPVI